MSIQAVAAVLESDGALPYALSQYIPLRVPKLTLVVLEATARGIVQNIGLRDVQEMVGCEKDALHRALNFLADEGIVALERAAGSVNIEFAGYRLTLEPFPPTVIDNPWQVIRAKVFATKGSQCHYCGSDASQVDHMLPSSRGGSDELSNLVPACARCNHAKADLTPEEWKAAT